MQRLLLFLLSAAALGQQASEISGDYLEGRSNHVFGCYCEWSAEAAMGGTEAIVAWNFKEGGYHGVPLAGTAAAAVIVGESTLSMGSAPRRSLLFLDSRASAPQQEAARAMILERYRQLLGEVLGVHSTPIQFTREGDRAALRIGEIARVLLRKAKLPQDALQGARLWYDPFIPLAEPTIAATLSMRYTGPEFDKRWEMSDAGTTGYYGRFRIAME